MLVVSLVVFVIGASCSPLILKRDDVSHREFHYSDFYQKKESTTCKGKELNIGYLDTVEQCANACRGKSQLFIYGRKYTFEGGTVETGCKKGKNGDKGPCWCGCQLETYWIPFQCDEELSDHKYALYEFRPADSLAVMQWKEMQKMNGLLQKFLGIKGWELVAEKTICENGHKKMEGIKAIAACAEACKKFASMFVVPTSACTSKSCTCYCEIEAKDGKCKTKSMKFYDLYKML